MAEKDLLVEVEKGIAIITLNRPAKFNAINDEMSVQLHKVVQDMRFDDGVKVIVITGSGSGFCSGIDLGSRAPGITQPNKKRWETISPIGYQLLPLARLEKPTVAAINGVAAGLGLSLALACDLRIASEAARFTAAWVKRGLVPDGGATYFLTRILGIEKALEMMVTGDIIDATEAQRIGLVSRVVPHNDLIKVVKEIADRIASGPSVAIELIKKAAYKAIDNSLESQLDFETYAQNLCRNTQDYHEGIQAFMEKRTPNFRGF